IMMSVMVGLRGLHDMHNKIRLMRTVPCLCLFLLLLAACSFGGGSSTATPSPTQKSTSSSFQCSSHSSNPVMLTMYYGRDKLHCINELVPDLTNRDSTDLDGQSRIKAVAVGTGPSVVEIIGGTIHPDIWSPEGSIWLILLNEQWQAKYHNDIIATGANSTP